MPAQSKQQVRLMRLVRGVQTGDTPKSKVDAKVKKMAKDMKPADVKDFAKTPESGLPEKKKQESLNEGEWNKIMTGVRKGDQSGPWALVVIDGMNRKKVIHQELVKIKDAIPAHYEDLKRKFKGDYIAIEDKYGRVVYNGRLGESVKESFKKSELNEDINPVALALLIQAGAAVGGAIAGMALTSSDSFDDRGIVQRIKDWWKSRKDTAAIEAIAKRLNKDPEVIEFAKSKKRTGWRELLKRKLTGNELNYINKVYRTHIQPKEEQSQPHSGQKDFENNPSVYKNAPQVKEGPKVKIQNSITQQEWDKTPKDYKAIIGGIKYKMMNTDKGTSLVPVNIKEAVEDCGCNKSEQNIHTSNKLSLKTAINGIKTK